jgi:hypothetical protein
VLEMIVVQFGDRTVKGYTDRSLWDEEQNFDLEFTIPIMIVGSGAPQNTFENMPVYGVKAIFFVKSFEGKQHDDLRFYDDREPMDCLWVRVTFHDDEVIEGIIRNDSSFVFNSCFLMSPVDPEGNNWLIYVIKGQLKNFQVLGIRPAPKHLPDFVHRPLATSSN